jgi:hypothetical protein
MMFFHLNIKDEEMQQSLCSKWAKVQDKVLTLAGMTSCGGEAMTTTLWLRMVLCISVACNMDLQPIMP